MPPAQNSIYGKCCCRKCFITNEVCRRGEMRAPLRNRNTCRIPFLDVGLTGPIENAACLRWLFVVQARRLHHETETLPEFR